MADAALARDVTAGSNWRAIEPKFYPGPGWRARLGLLVLTTDMASEWDLIRYTRLDGVDCYTSRMPMGLKADKAALAALTDEVVMATENLVPWAEFDAIAFCCTTGSIAVGPDKLRDMVQSVKPGVPVRNPVDSAIDALSALECNRVSVLTPYIQEVNETLEDYFIGRGLELTDLAAFGQDGDPEINRIDPQSIIDASVEMGGGDCEALFISCTGLCTSGIVQHIEDRIGKPVVTSNQALSWATLRAAGVDDPIDGFGRLFKLS
ncbi:MAG: Asp/Glu racemase [Alphaproteobacteria bacterium]|nr:Asp/Glu racemase [Alphaproteobacteria bacterium]